MLNSPKRKLKELNDALKLEDQLEILVGILAGAVIANGGLHFANPIFLAAVFLFGLLNLTGALFLNQYADIDADRLNKPYRPIPSGRIRARTMLMLGVIAYLVALVIGLLLDGIFLLLSAVSMLIGAAYSSRNLGLRNNILFSAGSLTICYVLLTFVAGWALYKPVSEIPWWFLVFLFFVDFAEALVKDYRDVRGDSTSHITTLPIKLGYARAAKLNLVLYTVPFLALMVATVFNFLNIKFAVMSVCCIITGSAAFNLLIKGPDKNNAIIAYRIVTANYFITRIIGAWAFLP